MRYLFSVVTSQSGTVLATADEVAAIDAFNERLERAGQRVIAVGVASPEMAVTFDNRDDSGIVRPGPYVECDDFVAGFWIVDAEDEHVAHQLAADASKACNRRIEVRPLLG
ncbi:MAG: hypothetical protein RI900_1233 [Actinomycetota bacterium]